MNIRASRSDPVCGTCRRRSRKCDRTRPQCHRCLSKGLVCEGYETKFKMYDVNSAPKRRQPADAKVPDKARHTDNAVPEPVSVDISYSIGCPVTPNTRTPPSLNSFAVMNTSPSDALSSLLSPINFEEDESSQLTRRQVLSKEDAQALLAHFETVSSDMIATLPGCCTNPFQLFMLPLAYEHSSLLHALLGFAASHISASDFPQQVTAAIEHKLLAIQALSSLLIKEECLGLTSVEEDITLSIVLLLLLQDICESGISSHGAHLNGVAFLCSRMAADGKAQTPFRQFLLSALSWFDLLRGLSGAEKLAFPPAVRRHVSTGNGFDLEVLTGCPKSIFEILGHVLTYGKSQLAGEITIGEFEIILGDSRRALEQWDATDETYPSSHPGWPLLADAYRHTALLRILRLPDAFILPCTDEGVRLSVRRILDISAQLSWDSPYYRRLLFPIFIAGADAELGHQHHYVQLCVERVTQTTGFHQPALLQLLQLVWRERAESDRTRNVPWMEYASHASLEIRVILLTCWWQTCSQHLRRQHDYLCF